MASVSVSTGNNHAANELLLYAADNGSLQGVEAALKDGADIDFELPSMGISNTGTALFIASMGGHLDIVRLLLRKGASLVKRTTGGFTLLHAAASEGKTDIVDLLVQHGATVDVRDGFKNTPLMAAAGNNHVDTVRRLIELGARPDLTDGYIAQGLGLEDGNYPPACRESIKMVQEARKTKLLRCCNPNCGKPGYMETLKRCSQCKLTRYCSRDCQIQHWSVGHKKCCGHDACSGVGPEIFNKLATLLPDHVREQAYANLFT
ncbi:uncharacterized protein LOC144876025 [Branchiostoma floridae x Branchiostoma japonicum]